MSTIKRILTKVSQHRRGSSLAPGSDPGSPEKQEHKRNSVNGIKHRLSLDKSVPGGEAAAKQAATQHNGEASTSLSDGSTSTPGSERPRRPSFTEMKTHRREERFSKDEEEKIEREKKKKEAHDKDPLKANYGYADVSEKRGERDTLPNIAKKQPGELVRFRARIHHLRALSPKIMFIVFRHQIHTLQGLLTIEDGLVSENMVRWAEDLHRETIVLVEGRVHEPREAGQEEVKGTTIHEVEVKIEKMYIVAEPTTILPFQVDDASRAREVYEHGNSHFTRVGERTRLNHRVLDLRTPASQAIFRIHAAVTRLFREHLTERGFVEINSSKFQEGATESGASVFKVDYFRRKAYLAQSPQLMKQMCIAADMERVFEVGPVFRAENSNTHRHLTEFTGLDLEMAFESDYHEVMDVIDGMFKHMFKSLYRDYREEIETVKKQFPHEDIAILDETPRLKFAEGIRMLNESGWKEDDGSQLTEEDDLSTRAEVRLGQLVKEKFGADYYILDKFPAGVRPFYTMPDKEDSRFSNSYDFFIRGEEILSGGQRIHLASMLEERMKEAKINPDSMRDYVDGFRWGCPPHGGGGIGLERVVMLFLKLGNIRWATLFPRDPRSFPSSKDEGEAALEAVQKAIVFGPTSTTFTDGRTHHDLPPIANLIAKYGDATNTSWVDPAWTIWRHDVTGAAVGYIPSEGFAVSFGNPLCDHRQIPQVVHAYLSHLESEKLKPVWCCIDHDTERYLASDLGWSAIVVVAEERLDPTEVHPDDDRNFRRKVHRAEREGVKIHEVSGEITGDLRKQIEQRLQEWTAGRKGEQVHLTGVRPFDDAEHRKYFYAVDKDGKICCLVVLAQLAPVHGFQIKWALEFPQAPTGAIEYILWQVIKKLADVGVHSATFGAGARDRLDRADNVGGFRVRTLEKTYNTLSHSFNLLSKADFRSKFGTFQDPLYICFPKGGLGVKGIEAIMDVVKKDK